MLDNDTFQTRLVTPLCTLVMETEGVFEIMATMWIEQGRGISGAFGFKTNIDIVFACHLHFDAILRILLQIIANCQGSADTAANIYQEQCKTSRSALGLS